MKSDEHWTVATVERIDDLSPTVRGLWLRPDEGVRPWTVGSHLRVRVEVGGRSDVRHYSLVGLPQASRAHGLYRIAVKRAEPGRGGSGWMWALHPGQTAVIAGPDNHFELPAAAAPHTLLVAGGIGITPILGMALTLAARGAPLRAVYAARDEAELVFAPELREALDDRLQTFADARGQRIDLAAEIHALPPRGQMLICGPVPLLQAAQAAWEQAGRAAADLRFETFGSSGNRPSETFWVRLPRHGLQIEVPADRSLLDVLEAHGVEALSDCRRGECGLCAVDIVDVQGAVDHRDVFFSAAEKRENRRLCACVSRVAGGGIVIDSAWRPDAAHAKVA
jgi:vanillate O-demethylase ferredoxin subunit